MNEPKKSENLSEWEKEVIRRGTEVVQSFQKKINQVLKGKHFGDGDEESAVDACIEDCYESFLEVYEKLLPELQKTNNQAEIADILFEVRAEFQHIGEHIKSALSPFEKLISSLEESS